MNVSSNIIVKLCTLTNLERYLSWLLNLSHTHSNAINPPASDILVDNVRLKSWICQSWFNIADQLINESNITRSLAVGKRHGE
mgnify:CR=1 FL=1